MKKMEKQLKMRTSKSVESPDNRWRERDDDDDDEYDNFYGAITQHMPLQGRLDKKPIACLRYDFSK